MATVVNAAKNGDMRAADILLRRLWPERKGRPVQMHLPAIMVPSDIVATSGAVAGAVAAGELSPEEDAAVAGCPHARTAHRPTIAAGRVCQGSAWKTDRSDPARRARITA